MAQFLHRNSDFPSLFPVRGKLVQVYKPLGGSFYWSINLFKDESSKFWFISAERVTQRGVGNAAYGASPSTSALKQLTSTVRRRKWLVGEFFHVFHFMEEE
jgi:hypothetical protein